MCRSVFAMKRLVEEYLGKDKKLYAAFMDLECAENLWCGWTAIKGDTDFL